MASIRRYAPTHPAAELCGVSAAEGGVSKPAQISPTAGSVSARRGEVRAGGGLGFDTALRAYSPRGRVAVRAYSPAAGLRCRVSSPGGRRGRPGARGLSSGREPAYRNRHTSAVTWVLGLRGWVQAGLGLGFDTALRAYSPRGRAAVQAGGGLGFDTALRAYSPRGRWAVRAYSPRGRAAVRAEGGVSKPAQIGPVAGSPSEPRSGTKRTPNSSSSRKPVEVRVINTRRCRPCSSASGRTRRPPVPAPATF